jgi:hypothetical protein
LGFEEKEPFLRTPISNPLRGGPARARVYGARPSPPEPELGDDSPVTLDVGALQVVQQPATLADQLEQPAPRIVVVGVRLEVVGEVVDPFAEDGDLDFGRSGVLLIEAVRLDDARFDARCQSVFLLRLKRSHRTKARLAWGDAPKFARPNAVG